MLGVAACDAVSAAFRHFQNSAAFHLLHICQVWTKKEKKGPASVLTITITVVTEAIKSYKWSAKSVIKFNILFLFRIVELRGLCAERRLTGGTSISEDSWRGLVAGIMIFFFGSAAWDWSCWEVELIFIGTDSCDWLAEIGPARSSAMIGEPNRWKREK